MRLNPTAPYLRLWSLALLLVATSVPAAVPPPRRDLAEVRAALAQAPPARTGRPLTVLLVANRKDHGAHEHDYPRWLERWSVLLGGTGAVPATMYGITADLPAGPKPGAARVTVETAADWPSAEQLRRADVVVAFMGTGGIWNEAKLRDLRALLDRGAGFVALHSAVIAEKPHARPLADLLGLAWEGGTTLFRHGPLDLKIAPGDDPITRGLPERIHFEDETYWPLVGDASRVHVLATADEPVPGTGKLGPQPMFWTHTVGKGRVFNSILGHYSWTFDDPYFRILVLRGIAWAAGESPYRFDPLVLAGARVTDRKPEVARTAPAPAVAPVAPAGDDPNLLLWLDASDRATVAAGPDGRVEAWTSKAAGPGGKLTGEGARRPLFVAAALGGRPAVRFDGVDDVLRSLAFRQSSPEWTVAMVVTPRSNAGLFRALLAANRPGQDDFQTGFNLDLGPGETAEFNSLNLEGSKGGGATNLRTGSAAFGAGQVLVISAGPGSARLWVNGREEEGRGASDAVTVMDELRLGARYYMGAERGYFHGDVSEILLYRTQLSEAQRAGLTAHLLKKYGPEIQPPAAVSLDPWDYLPAYDWGGTRRPLTPIDEAVGRAKTDARARKALESRLIEVAADRANTPASRDYACRRLAIIGSAASVPTLSRMLDEPGLLTLACFALERIPGPEAERALADALGRVPGPQRAEVTAALGGRRSATAVPTLAALLEDTDPAVRQAAVRALGNTGGPAAAAALTAALDRKPDPETAAALLRCAEELQADGKEAAAEPLYERLRKPDVPAPSRRAALRALILLRGTAGVPLLLETLGGSDPQAQAMALLLVRELPGREATLAVASELDRLSPEARARTLTALADRGDTAATPAVRAALRSEVPEVRLAAVRALGRVGGASDVPALLDLATGADAELAAAAKGSLAALPGPQVDAALLRSLEQGETSKRAAAGEALGRRGFAAATFALLGAAQSPEPALRVAALRALGEAAPPGVAPMLVELLIRAKEPREVQAAEKALAAIYARTDEKEPWVDALLAGLPGAGPEAKAALLRNLSLHGGPKALRAVTAAVSDAGAGVQDEALGLLAAWESPEAAEPLLALAGSAPNPAHRALALRGYLRMGALPGLPPARRLEIAREGLRLAQRDDERRLALAVLAQVPSAEALGMVVPLLERAGLVEEAGAAAVAIAQKLLPDQPAAVLAAMDRVRRVVKNEELLRQAAGLRARAEQAGR